MRVLGIPSHLGYASDTAEPPFNDKYQTHSNEEAKSGQRQIFPCMQMIMGMNDIETIDTCLVT
jgi:hypothetical protein